MKIETFSMGKFRPYARSLRKNDRSVERMMASIREFGFKIPVLARTDGEVVDGDLRLKAAKKLGMTEVPVILCDEWSVDQVKAFRLLVNRSANWASWDLDLVALEIKDLKVSGFDLNLTGFNSSEIDSMLFSSQATENDAGEGAAPTTPVSQTGDVWICGSHRLLCGDSTSEKDVRTLLGDVTPVVMITDPPYGVKYDATWRETAGLGKQRQTGVVHNDDRVDWTEAYRLFAGNVCYVWHAGVHTSTVAANLEAAGLRIRSQIIWAKQHFAMSRGDYHWQHEPCYYAVREGKPSNWCGDRKQTTLWSVSNLSPFGRPDGENEATGHSAQKPIELMRRPILNNTKIGDAVYDPFLGSGTTLIAAQLTDRICYGLEIDPAYADMIVQRWQKVAQREAVLQASGLSFEEERRAKQGAK
jgi:DNA modification methylase